MKKINLILSFAIVMAMTMYSCKKEKGVETPFENQQPGVRLITFNTTDRDAVTMLEFSSTSTYDSTIVSLEQQVETLEDAFLAQYGYLNDSLLNLKEEEIGYNEQQPLIDFENSLNFTNSMRQLYVVLEEDWLDNDTLDPATDPANTYVFDIVEMSLLNENGEVKIGNSYLKFSKDGFIEITDGDTTILMSDGSDCTWWKGKDYPDDYDKNKRVIRNVRFHAYPWKGVSTAKITSYKKRGRRWKKYRTSLGVANQTYYRTRICLSFGQNWSGWKRKRAKSIKKGNTKWGYFPGVRAEKDRSVFGRFPL